MRPLPRYVLAIMAGFVAFELWVPLLAIILRALAGPTIPTAVQAVVPLFGLAVPTVIALGLSDYLADRPGLVRPYQPKRREAASDQDLADDEEYFDDQDEETWQEDEDTASQEHPPGDDETAETWRDPGAGDNETAKEGRNPGAGDDETAKEGRESGAGEDQAAGARRPSGGQSPGDDPERPGRG